MKITRLIIYITVITAAAFTCVTVASAYWVWTPDTKKFLNPKYAVKDSPKEQYDWAMTFYEAKDYQRAASEFDKLTKSYEFSEYAGKSQYHVGLCYENMEKYYIAFQAYQKAIDNFPHLDNIDEIIARQFNIANLYEAKTSPKVLGTDILTSTDRVVEIYKKVVENAPYGKLADTALFNMAQALKSAERYDEAVSAFQKLLDEYPDSQFTERARYEVAYCAYKSSLKPAYDQESTDKAIRAFSEFSQENKDELLTKEADKTIQRLKDKAAEKSLLTAQFYEKIKRKESAIIYYKDIIDRYPDCSYANMAKMKIEELKFGKKPARVTAVLSEKGALFGLWPTKAPAPAAKPKEILPGAAAEPAGQKPGWMPLNFDKKGPPKEREVKSAEATAPMSKPKWAPLSFGKKALPPVTDKLPQVTAPAVTAPALQESPAPIVETPAVAPVPQEAAAPAAETPAPSPAPNEPVLTPITPASNPSPVSAAAPIMTLPAPTPIVVPPKPVVPISRTPPKPQKNSGWTPLNILGFGKEPSPQPTKPPQPAPVVVASAPVAEPLPVGSGVILSTDDVNVDNDYTDLY